jgi:DinB superfamily
MDLDWNFMLVDQLDWLWRNQTRPRLAGLTDKEYFAEPAPDCWSVRLKGTSSAPISVGGGDYALDFAFPAPDPPPVTTIAWRLAHVIVGVFGSRVASHFGGPPVAWDTFEYAGTADAALAQLDAGHAAWTAGVRGLGADGLARPCGPAEGQWAEASLADLVLHINKEVIHHLAEVCLLRDLYRAQG